MERILQLYIHYITHVTKHIFGPLVRVCRLLVFRAGLDRMNVRLPADHRNHGQSGAGCGGTKSALSDSVQCPGCEKGDADCPQQVGCGRGYECDYGASRPARWTEEKERQTRHREGEFSKRCLG